MEVASRIRHVISTQNENLGTRSRRLAQCGKREKGEECSGVLHISSYVARVEFWCQCFGLDSSPSRMVEGVLLIPSTSPDRALAPHYAGRRRPPKEGGRDWEDRTK